MQANASSNCSSPKYRKVESKRNWPSLYEYKAEPSYFLGASIWSTTILYIVAIIINLLHQTCNLFCIFLLCLPSGLTLCRCRLVRLESIGASLSLSLCLSVLLWTSFPQPWLSKSASVQTKSIFWLIKKDKRRANNFHNLIANCHASWCAIYAHEHTPKTATTTNSMEFHIRI